jgi:uncharacterized protein YegJ (DUF2314 family)
VRAHLVKIGWRSPGGNITWLAIIWLVLGTLFVSVFARGLPRTWLWFSLGASMLTIAVGLWFRQRWARWAGFAVAAALLALRVSEIARNGIHLGGSLRLLVNLWYVCALWEWGIKTEDSVEEEARAETHSLVQLLREPRYLDQQILARLASNAWGQAVQIGLDENSKVDDSTCFIMGGSPHFLAQRGRYFFAIHNVDAPYFDDCNEPAEATRNLRVRQPLTEHRAWLSVDALVGADDAEAVAEAYRCICRLHAELFDDNCLALYCQNTSRFYPVGPGTEDSLRAADPLVALTAQSSLPVIDVADDDPRMQAAVEEARRRWPEFVRAFESRAGDSKFAVKAGFEDGEHVEGMWLIVTAIEHDVAYGRVDNDPLNVRGIKPGDMHRVPSSEIWDWMYFDGSEMKGGFSILALRDIQSSANDGEALG